MPASFRIELAGSPAAVGSSSNPLCAGSRAAIGKSPAEHPIVFDHGLIRPASLVIAIACSSTRGAAGFKSSTQWQRRTRICREATSQTGGLDRVTTADRKTEQQATVV